MSTDYNIKLNYAASGDDIPYIWFAINGALDVGQAMGVMGLPYSVLVYNEISLNITTKDGQTRKVILNVE